MCALRIIGSPSVLIVIMLVASAPAARAQLTDGATGWDVSRRSAAGRASFLNAVLVTLPAQAALLRERGMPLAAASVEEAYRCWYVERAVPLSVLRAGMDVYMERSDVRSRLGEEAYYLVTEYLLFAVQEGLGLDLC